MAGGLISLPAHGLHVSPQGTGDNVFVTVDRGNSFKYEYHLPADRPTGVYWLHPHHHGMVADQVFAVLFGAIIVEDAEAPDVSRERVLIISDITEDAFQEPGMFQGNRVGADGFQQLACLSRR